MLNLTLKIIKALNISKWYIKIQTNIHDSSKPCIHCEHPKILQKQNTVSYQLLTLKMHVRLCVENYTLSCTPVYLKWKLKNKLLTISFFCFRRGGGWPFCTQVDQNLNISQVYDLILPNLFLRNNNYICSFFL